MKKRLFLLLCCVSLGLSLQAQQKQEMTLSEKEIKLSGKYYYGDVFEQEEKNALELAIEDMKLMITTDIAGKYSGVDSVNFGTLVSAAVYSVIRQESLYRVVIHVPKNVLKFQQEGNRMDITVQQPVVAEVKVVEKPVEEGKIKKDTLKDTVSIVVVTQKTEPVEQDTSYAAQGVMKVFKTLKRLESLEKIIAYLEEETYKGELIFGRMKTLQNPDACYFLEIADGRVHSVLSEGNTDRRKEVFTGKMINYKTEFSEEQLFWIRFIEE